MAESSYAHLKDVRNSKARKPTPVMVDRRFAVCDLGSARVCGNVCTAVDLRDAFALPTAHLVAVLDASGGNTGVFLVSSCWYPQSVRAVDGDDFSGVDVEHFFF